VDITLKLNEEEIKNLIENHIQDNGIATEGKHLAIELHAGRGGNGHSATIQVMDEPAAKVKKKAATKAKKAPAKKSASKPDTDTKEEETVTTETSTEVKEESTVQLPAKDPGKTEQTSLFD